jgi:uncharacterized protein YjbI with pentapeptide repeats/Tfp pilus assembly protein PilF
MKYPTIEWEAARLEQLRARWQAKLVKQVVGALNEGQDLKPFLNNFPKFNSTENIDLRGIDLSRQHLTGPAGKGVDFSSANLLGANFQQTRIEGARFLHADLTGVDFSESEMPAADFSHSLAYKANFQRAKILFGKFNAANLDQSNFAEADLTGSDFSSARAHRAGFRSAQLTQVNFDRAKLKGADFRNAAFQGTSFGNANLEETDLRGTAIEQAVWRGVTGRTALLDPGKPAIHQSAMVLPGLHRLSDGLNWVLEHIGNLAKLILLITFIWLLFWIYHRISPPDKNTVELIPFEVVIDGKQEKEYGIFLTNKLIESRNRIFAVLERIQPGNPAAAVVADPALAALNHKLAKDETAGEAELVLGYRSGEIVNQKLMLSNLSNYRRFEKYSFPMTDFQVLQFIFDLRRVKTTNPILSGTFDRSQNQIKAVVRLEQGDQTIGIWALDSSELDSTDDVSLIYQLALQMVKDELSQQNPFFKDLSVRGFGHYLQGLERLNQYLEIKKYQDVVTLGFGNLLVEAKTHFEIATVESFSFAPAFYYLGIVHFERGKTSQKTLEACIENYQTTWKLLVQQLTQLAARDYTVPDETQLPQYDLYQETRENLTNTLYNLAQAYHFNSRYFTAASREFAENIQSGIDFYFAAMRFDSLNTNIYVNLAEAYKKLQKLQLAQKYYSRAIALGATDAANYYQLGHLYAQEGGEKLTSGVRMLEKATAAAPGNPLFHFALGEMYLQTAQLELAENAFATVYRVIDKNNAENFLFFAQKFFKDELFDFAVTGYNQADSLLTERRQINPLLKFNLGLSLHHLKNYETAIPYFKEAQQFEQFKGSASYNLACAFSQLEKIPEACSWLKAALELDAVSFDMAELDDDLAPLRESDCFKRIRQP